MTNPTAAPRTSVRGVLTLLACALGVWAGYALWADVPAAAQTEPAPETPAGTPPAAAPETPAAAADAPAAPAAPENSAAALQLLAQARKNLLGRPFRARLTEVIGRGDNKLRAEGEFVQGPDLKMRLEVKIETGRTEARLLQVCDGEVLFTEQRINESIRLTRRNVLEILAEVERVGAGAKSRLVGELGLGGITGLLASLEENMAFAAPTQESVDGEPLQVIEGRWNAQFLAQIQASPQAAERLPRHLPDGVRVYFDASGFPRRIRYLKRADGEEELRPLVTLDFNGIEWLDGPQLDPTQFQYEAPQGVFQKELTREYLEMIRGQ